MRVLVTGAGGQAGQELKLALASHTVAALTKADLDITDAEATLQVIGRFRPDMVIHAAAYTNVDGCERDPE
jgi:dTDP-4-dehydrorhamnose reductase